MPHSIVAGFGLSAIAASARCLELFLTVRSTPQAVIRYRYAPVPRASQIPDAEVHYLGPDAANRTSRGESVSSTVAALADRPGPFGGSVR